MVVLPEIDGFVDIDSFVDIDVSGTTWNRTNTKKHKQHVFISFIW
jgi:hypothetical protein